MKITTEAQQELKELDEGDLKQAEEDLDKGLKELTPAKKIRGHNLKGRLKGVKNKSTIFKEVMQKKFEVKMTREFEKVLMVLLEKAQEGDVPAIKMLMDRVIPQSKSVDLGEMAAKKGISINVNIGGMDKDDPTVIN